MKRKWKRLAALIMALSMITGLFPTNVTAAEIKEAKTQSVLQDVSDVAMKGSDSIGTLLSDVLSEAEEESSKLEEQNSYISDLEISGNQADVVYYTEQDAEIVVAVYDEETKQMLASGKVYAPNGSETRTATVTIEGDMPQYYNVSAFMLDAGNHEPLCEAYSTNLYNRAMQELEMSTVADYDAEQVLNLDESEETNFVVYGEETKIITYSADKNQVTDNGDGTYVIVNADSDFTSLRIGDIFSYCYQDGSVLIAKVKSISVDGTTVTVTEDAELDLESVFDYVKIEGGIKNPPEQEAETYYASRGITQENSSSFTASINQKIVDNNSMDGSKENSCTIKGSLKIYGYVKAYISLKNQYIEAKVSLSLSGELELKGSCKKREVELLPEAPYLTICPGVFMQVNPVFVVEFSASVKTGVTVSAAAGMKYDSDSGAKNTSEKPSLKGEFKAEGAVFIGFKPIAEAYILSDKVGGALISAEAGLKLTASYAKEEASGASSKHQCNECLSGKLSAELKIAAKIDVVGKVVFNYEIAKLSFPNILECYYSFDYGEFAWTKCPHKAYRITVRVKDEKGNAIGGVTVMGQGFDLNVVTDLNGTAAFYLPDGSYGLVLNKGKNSATARFLVDGKARDVEVTMKNEEAGIVASGQCGPVLYWELDENGLLVISSAGSYASGTWWTSYANIPWKDYLEDIKAVIIEDEITSIGDSAFEGCKSLTSITLPTGVTSIGRGAFSGCSSLTSITLPTRITSIGDGAFFHCSSLISITLPTGVTSIGRNTFSGCSALTSITLSTRITSIGDNTFSGCSALTSITLPTGITSIGDTAFRGCSSLTNITFPIGMTSVGREAFSGCSSLTNITFPIGMTSVGREAFSGCSSLTSITLPTGVTSIGDSAFRGCSSLTSITLPYGVTGIEKNTFEGCKSLTSITLPTGVTSIGRGAFSGCSSLTSITLPTGVTSIGNSAFRYCSSLTNIMLPTGVTSIGDYAFYHCSSLTGITLPSGVTSIGREAFYNCSSLTSITLPIGMTSIGNSAFSGCSSLASITLPSGVTSIENSTFSGCSSLASITLPAGITSIGDYAFRGCGSLASMTLPAGITSVGGQAFSGCSSLTSIILPTGLTSVGREAFRGCNSLTSITLPSGVTSIGREAFYNCRSLTSITLPFGVTSIENSTFSGCSSLASITLPAGITSIGDSAFRGCSSLTSMALPFGVTSIGDSAFGGCSSLASIMLPSSITGIGDSAFSGCSSLASIILPFGVTSIGDSAFRGCSSLTSITLPFGVTSIGDYAFSGCSRLTSITIPFSVTSIGNQTFFNCTKLSVIYYGGSEEDWKAISIGDNNLYLNRAIKHFNDNGSGEGGNEGGDNDPNKKSISSMNLNSVTALLDGLPVGFSGTIYLQDGTTASMVEWADIINSITWSISDTSIVDDFTCQWIESLREESSMVLILGVTPVGVGTATITGTLPDGTKFNCTVTVNAVDDAVDATGISDVSAVSQNASDNVHIGDISESGMRKTASFAGLVPNNLYVILAVKQADADDLLAAGNLLYITQGYADISGNLALDYVPRADDNSVALAYGYKETKAPSDDKTPDGDNTLSETPVVTPDNAMAAEIDKVILKKSSYTYNGKKRAPNVTVQAGAEILVKNRDYTVSYANNVKVGTASVTVEGIGQYTGTIVKTFKIVPKGTSISKKITAKSKGFCVKWKKQNKQTTGYELQYSTSKKFTKKTTKIKNIKKNTKLTVKKLKAKKKYYVRIRTYKTVKGKKYYSNWSKCKSVTTKK